MSRPIYALASFFLLAIGCGGGTPRPAEAPSLPRSAADLRRFEATAAECPVEAPRGARCTTLRYADFDGVLLPESATVTAGGDRGEIFAVLSGGEEAAIAWQPYGRSLMLAASEGTTLALTVPKHLIVMKRAWLSGPEARAWRQGAIAPGWGEIALDGAEAEEPPTDITTTPPVVSPEPIPSVITPPPTVPETPSSLEPSAQPGVISPAPPGAETPPGGEVGSPAAPEAPPTSPTSPPVPPSQ